MRLLERVGEEDVQAFALRHRERSLFPANLDGELEVADRVGRHQQLEAEQARQQVLAHVVRPRAAESLLRDRPADQRDDLAQEGTGAGRRIEDQHPRARPRFSVRRLDLDGGVVGEAVGEAELVAQQPVDAADDVGDDRLGRVVDAAQFAQLRVVGGEEVLVEVHDRILLPCVLPEVLEDRRHVGTHEQQCEVVHDPGDAADRRLARRRA